MQDGAISPRYAVILGAACGFFLVGTLLAVAVLVGDMGADTSKPVAPRKTVTTADQEALTKKIKKLDEMIADMESRFAKMTDELAAARAKSGGAGGKPVEKGATGSEPKDAAAGNPDYSGRAGAPEVSMADPAVAGKLAALNLDQGHEEEWKDAVQEVYRELRRDEMVEGRNMRTGKIVDLFTKNLHLTDEQKALLVDIRHRESEKLAELYSRINADNSKEITAELMRVQFASAEEFKKSLNPDQAVHVGQTLGGLR